MTQLSVTYILLLRSDEWDKNRSNVCKYVHTCIRMYKRNSIYFPLRRSIAITCIFLFTFTSTYIYFVKKWKKKWLRQKKGRKIQNAWMVSLRKIHIRINSKKKYISQCYNNIIYFFSLNICSYINTYKKEWWGEKKFNAITSIFEKFSMYTYVPSYKQNAWMHHRNWLKFKIYLVGITCMLDRWIDDGCEKNFCHNKFYNAF